MVYQVKYKKRGFTLVEMVIVIALFAIFASISVLSYSGFKSHSLLTTATYDVVEATRHAQSNAQNMKEDSKWGIKIFSDKVVIFRGATYASRNTPSDQVLGLSKNVTISGLNEIVFDKITGWTSNVGTTTVTGVEGVKNIHINEKGTITY